MHIPGAKAIITALMTLNFVPGVAVYIPLYMQMIDMKLSGSLWMLILPYLTWHIPFSIYIFKNFFDSIPSELMEAARVDGSGEVRLFFKVILLGAARRRYSNGVQFHRHLGRIHVGQHRLLVLHQDSDDPVGLLYFRGEYGIEWGPFAAAITIIVVPLIAIFIYLQRYFIQCLTSGAVKG